VPERDRAFREALAAAVRGWPVVQVYGVDTINLTCRCGGRHERDHDIGKHPIGDRWPERATTDVEALRRAEYANPGSNYGIATGDRLVVLDLDEGGERAIAEQERVLGPLPATVRVLTGGGGEHRLFIVPAGGRIPNRVGLLPGVDVRGYHGQAVLPGSLHQSGRRYTWAPGASPDEVALAELPPAWLRLLLPPRDHDGRSDTETVPSRAFAARGSATWSDDRVDPAFRGTQPPSERQNGRQREDRLAPLPPVVERIERARAWLARSGPAVSGERGWRKTNKAVIAVVRGLAVPEREALALLGEWNATCRPPWSERELRDKVEWVTRKATHLGRPGFMLGKKDAIASPADALALIARIEAAVEALPTAGSTADTDRAEMMALIAFAKLTGSVVVAMAGRTGAERGRVRRQAARAALRRLAEACMIRRVSPPPFTNPGTAAYELLPPERWCRITPVPKGHQDPDRYWDDAAPVLMRAKQPPEFGVTLAALDRDLFRRSFDGHRGLGPKARTLLAALLVAKEPVAGSREAKRKLPAVAEWPHTTVGRVKEKLEAAGLLDGWKPLGGLGETLVLITVEEHRRGLAGATDRQREEHRREREGREERMRSMASAVELVLARHGEMTVTATAQALGDVREATVFETLQWLKTEKRVVCRRTEGVFVWATGDVTRDPFAERAEVALGLDAWDEVTEELEPLDGGEMQDAAGRPPLASAPSPGEGQAAKLPEPRRGHRADAGVPKADEQVRDPSCDRPMGALLAVLRDRTGAVRGIVERATWTGVQDDDNDSGWDELDGEVDEDAA
jgi:hypothetical protein